MSREIPFAIPMLKNKYKNIKPTAKRPKSKNGNKRLSNKVDQKNISSKNYWPG